MDSEVFIPEILENLPQLYPVWHDVCYQQAVRMRNWRRYSQTRVPDFGGFGVDITAGNEECACKEVKYKSDNFGFAASKCSIPFFGPRKVADLLDPCLVPLNAAREEFHKFCTTLNSCRKSFCLKARSAHHKELLALQKKLKIMSLEKTFKKIELPLPILQLATNVPKKVIFPPINMSFAGGSLAVSGSVEGYNIILYPTGEKLNKLGLTALKEGTDPDKYFSPLSDKNKTINLKKDCILQISNTIDGYCYVRQKESCHFVDFTELNNVSSSRLIYREELMSISSSPYNPSDYIVIYDRGNLEFNNLEVGETLWRLKKLDYYFPYGEIDTVQCSFGSHPQSIMCLNEKYCYIFDMRIKGNKKSVLFSCADNASCSMTEKLMNIKGCAVSSFQHVISSDNHLFVCDERYPKTPVLIYNHMLDGYPLYCDATKYCLAEDSSDVIVVLSSQDSNELSAFSIRAQHSLVQPIALSPPLHLSSPTDCIDSLKLHCIHVDDVIAQRFSYPLTGVSIISHKNSGFSTFQLNSLGDLFYQDFYKTETENAEKSYKVNTGCILTPPEKLQPHLYPFMSLLKEDTSESFHPSSNGLKVDLTAIFTAMESLHLNCGLAHENVECIINNGDSSSLCSFCGCNSVQSRNLKNSFKELSLLSGSTNEASIPSCFDVSQYYNFNDSLSKKLLDVWEFEDNYLDLETTMCNYDSDFSFAISTPNVSYPSSESSIVSDKSSSSTVIDPDSKDDLVKRLFADISAINSNAMDISNLSQESTDDIIPSSQETLPLIGETVHELRRSKVNTKRTSSSGF